MSSDAALAQHLHRLAVLISAGVSPAAAWGHVADAADPADEIAQRVAASAATGCDVPTAIDAALGSVDGMQRPSAERPSAERSWRALEAAWRVALASGAPLAPALKAFADALRDREAARRDIDVALAGPRSTARIVMVLPAVAVLLGLLMGVDLAATLMSPLGAASLGVGGVLIVTARRWMRRLLRAAEPPQSSDALALDLLAVAVAGGGAPESAATLVSHELERVSAPVDASQLEGLVRLSRRAGAPLGELARAEAAQVRARERAEAREGAERLAVRLMLPLGACVLPSFLLLGVVPMLIGLLSSTARVF